MEMDVGGDGCWWRWMLVEMDVGGDIDFCEVDKVDVEIGA